MAKLTGNPGMIVKVGAGTGTNVTSSIDSAAVHDVLTRAWDADNPDNEYIYLQGVASTVAGSVVTYDEAGATTLIAANAIGPVAVAMAATVASTYGWYQIAGTATAACDAGITDNAKVYIDGTSGRVDDTVVLGDQIMGAIFRGTDSSNLVSVQLNYPYASDSLG